MQGSAEGPGVCQGGQGFRHLPPLVKDLQLGIKKSDDLRGPYSLELAMS